MTILWLDFETRSPIDIKTTCILTYAEPATILMAAMAIDDEQPILVDLYHGESIPERYYAALRDPTVRIGVFNGSFEYEILAAQQAVGKFADIPIDVNRWYDVATQAAEHGCGVAGDEGGSVSLKVLCDLLGAPLTETKGNTGTAMINLFSCPQKDGRFVDPDDEPIKWRIFKDYCVQDVVATRWCAKHLPTCNYPDNAFEWELAYVDQQMNRIGIPVDWDFAARAEVISEVAGQQANQRLAFVTGCALTSISQTVALRQWLASRGYLVDDVQASTLEQLDIAPSDTDVAEVVALRLASGSAQAKYKTLLDLTWDDGTSTTVPYSLVFCGASRTRRWSGRGFQPQNLKRPERKDVELAYLRGRIMRDEDVSTEPDLLSAMGDLARSAIKAPPGHLLVDADLSGIENRVLMWIAQDRRELQLFRDLDAGIAPFDTYKMTYSKAFGIQPDQVTSEMRMVGKVMALSLQYWGGVGALLKFVRKFRLNVDAMVAVAYANCDRLDIERSKANYDYMKNFGADMRGNGGEDRTHKLTEYQYVGLDIIKCKWRDAHPEVELLGKTLKQFFRMSLESKGKVLTLPSVFSGSVQFVTHGDFTFMKLPTGDLLTYYKARYTDKDGITVATVKHRKVQRAPYYESSLLENVASGTSRMILANGLMRIWKDPQLEQLTPFLTIHDEIVSYAPATVNVDAILKRVIELMVQPVPGCDGLPLNAKGWIDQYFKKD